MSDAAAVTSKEQELPRSVEFEWDSQQAVRYETAVELLGQLIAACSARLHTERLRDEPSEMLLEECCRLRGELARRQSSLRPGDDEEVADVGASFRELGERITRLV